MQTTDLFNLGPAVGNGLAMGCGLGKSREFFLKQKGDDIAQKNRAKNSLLAVFLLCLASAWDASKRNCILE